MCRTLCLTTGAVADSIVGTTGNDTITGAVGSLLPGDVIVDGSTTDMDVLNVVMNATNGASTIANIEKINVDWTGFGDAAFDATSVTGATIALSSSKLGFVGTSTITAAAANKVEFGAGMTGVQTVNGLTTSTVNAGTASGVTITGSTALTDAVTVTSNGNLNLNSTLVEKLTVNNTFAGAKVTLASAIVDSLNVTGAVATTIKTTAVLATGKVITNSLTAGNALTVEVTGAGASDLSKIDATSFVLSGGAGGVTTVKTGAVIAAAADLTTVTITGAAATATTNTATFNNTAALQTAVNSTAISSLTVNSAAPAAAGLPSAVDATYTALNVGTNNVILTGTNDVQVTLGTAKVADASALVGALTYTTIAADTTVKGGSGANKIKLEGLTTKQVYIGLNGGDTVDTRVTTGTATITAGNGNNTITATGIIGKLLLVPGVLDVTTGSGNDKVVADAATTGTVSASLGDGTNTVSATGITSGILAVTGGAGVDTVTTGNLGNGATVSLALGGGDDVANFGVINAATTAIIAINGGLGNDTVTFKAGSSLIAATLTLTDVENIKLSDTGSMTFDAAQLSGKNFTMQGSGNLADKLLVSSTVATGSNVINLSTLTMDASVEKGLRITEITAGGANDTITGTIYADTIKGGAGNDIITGGKGVDALSGEAGSDTFVFAAGDTGITLATADTISDFLSGTDKISLGVAATSTNFTYVAAPAASFDAVKVLADAAFAADTGGAKAYYVGVDGGNTYVFIDRGADGVASEEAIILTGVLVVTAADIVA